MEERIYPGCAGRTLTGSSRLILVVLATLTGSSRLILVVLATLMGSFRLILVGLGNQRFLQVNPGWAGQPTVPPG